VPRGPSPLNSELVAAPRIEVDVSCFPLVFQTTHLGYTQECVRSMLDAFDALLSRGERYALVAHYRLEAGMMRAADRKLVSDWWAARKLRIQSLNVLTVTVLPSAILRGGMTAILWVVQPAIPITSAATIDDAVRIAADGLRAAGVPLSAALQKRLR
jgi:hypothetical protein